VGIFERLLTLKEAAALLRIHPKTLQNMALRREVPAIKILHGWRFRESDLTNWIDSLVRQPGNTSGPLLATGRRLPRPVRHTVERLRGGA
jgi:excisionase family DNA binding protein